MKTLSLKALNDKSILLKGSGVNQILEVISLDKIPGSIFIHSEKTAQAFRIYCIYDDYESAWVFAFANTKAINGTNPLNYFMEHGWDAKGNTFLDLHIPEDSIIELEGQFAES